MLSAPSYVMWLLSTVLAALVIALKYFSINIPVLTDIVAGKTFEVLLVAFALLWIATVIRRL